LVFEFLAYFFSVLAGGGSITFGGDDDMFLALNNAVVGQVGGNHPAGTTSTVNVAAGDYLMNVF
jgi:hypothetical protein